MKKTILLLLPALLIFSCNRIEEPQEREFELNFNIGNYPSYVQTKDVGVTDPGKTSWEEDDVLHIFVTDTCGNVTAYRLTYTDGGWSNLEKYSGGSYSQAQKISVVETDKTVAAFYAPSYAFDGAALVPEDEDVVGLNEFLSWSSPAADDVTVTFERNYSRIRVSADEGSTVTMACSEFLPASNSTDYGEYSGSAEVNSDGNAFFYGSWPEGAEIKVTAKDSKGTILNEKTFADRPVSVACKSYAIDCKEDYLTIAKLSASATTSKTSFSNQKFKDVTVTYVSGNYNYIEDVTGGILLYMKSSGLSVGQTITGTVSGTVVLYDGASTVKDESMAYAELTALNYSAATVTAKSELPLTEVTVAEINANPHKYYNRRCLIKEATVTTGISTSVQSGKIEQNGSSIIIFNKNKAAVIAAGLVGDLVCYPSYHYSAGLELLVYETSNFTEKIIPAEENAFTDENTPGVYDISGLESSNAISPIRTVEQFDQKTAFKSSSSRAFRIQNLAQGELYSIEVNSASFTNGSSCTYSYTGFSDSTLETYSSQATVVKSSSSMVWLKDTSKNKGYILELN